MEVQKEIKKISFLDFLKQSDTISEEQYHLIIKKNITDDALSDYLEDNAILSKSYFEFIYEQYNETSYVDLSRQSIDASLVKLLPENLARSCKTIIYAGDSVSYKVGMINPQDIDALDKVKDHLRAFVEPALVDYMSFNELFYQHYRHMDRVDDQCNLVQSELSYGSGDEVLPVDFFDMIIHDAYYLTASDIHIETEEEFFRVRIRMDGRLDERVYYNLPLGEKVLQLLKILGKLDITEQIMPQDGGFKYEIDNKTTYVRLSIIPIDHGQSAVIRILEHMVEFSSLDSIFEDSFIKLQVRNFLNKREGVLLITGPTGSGKTTTLYTCLREINEPDIKIISIEDPIESFLHRVNQIQVIPDTNFNFSTALKFILRQDPDVILLGEIRDEESANIATRAAITGHKVLTTLHTVDTVTAISRLINLNVPGYQVSSSLDLILAQRLLHRVCHFCSEPYELTDNDRENLLIRLKIESTDLENLDFKMGMGCNFCNQTGCRGMVGVFELLVIDNKMKEMISFGNIEEFQSYAYDKLEKNTLIQQSYKLARQGIISLKEALGV